MRQAARTAPFSACYAARGDLQDHLPAPALPLWPWQDQGLPAALSPSEDCMLLGAPHSPPSRDEPAACQSEASSGWASLEALREGTARPDARHPPCVYPAQDASPQWQGRALTPG